MKTHADFVRIWNVAQNMAASVLQGKLSGSYRDCSYEDLERALLFAACTLRLNRLRVDMPLAAADFGGAAKLAILEQHGSLQELLVHIEASFDVPVQKPS